MALMRGGLVLQLPHIFPEFSHSQIFCRKFSWSILKYRWFKPSENSMRWSQMFKKRFFTSWGFQGLKEIPFSQYFTDSTARFIYIVNTPLPPSHRKTSYLLAISLQFDTRFWPHWSYNDPTRHNKPFWYFSSTRSDVLQILRILRQAK